MIRRLRPRTVELEIDAMNTHGHGIGTTRDDEGVEHEVEVPYTVPGDYVKVMVSRKRHQRWCGALVEVMRPGASRTVPRCRHFGVCGGCSLQQMTYATQLHCKETYIHRCFEKFVKRGTQINPIIPSMVAWEYRNKMEYTFSNDTAGAHFLGLIMHGSKRRVLNLTECHLVSSWFTDALECVRQWWKATPLQAYHPYKDEGTLRTLMLREGKSSGDRLAMITVSGNPEYAPAKVYLNLLVAALRAAIEPKNDGAKLSIFLRIQQACTGMTTNFYEMLLYGPDYIREDLIVEPHVGGPSYHLHLRFSPTAFFQPHAQQASNLYSLALQLANIQPHETVYDLYCGIGTIGICASRVAKEVVGIEMSPESALDARLNAKINAAHNVTIYAGAVRHVLSKIRLEGRHSTPDVIFIDPPRAGLDPLAMRSLLEQKASRLVYISCNPKTQVADLEHLVACGYRLVTVQPLDQFPQVAHVENIALLVWSDAPA